MAPSFGRSISFQLSPARATTTRRHVRSISLPCPSSAHPLLAHLQAQTAAARAWATVSPTSPSTGLALIDALHAALAELLLLPEPQSLLRGACSCAAADRLLDAFLLLADAHRGFQEALLALRRHAADARAALRRRDAARLASASRAQRRGEKDLARLAANVSSSSSSSVASRSARLSALGSATADEAEMAAALMDAAAASAAASAAVFSAVAAVSAAASNNSKTKAPAAFVAAAFARKPETTTAAGVAPEKLEELERCIDECESGSETVFRSILRTRVSLLNIRTPAI